MLVLPGEGKYRRTVASRDEDGEQLRRLVLHSLSASKAESRHPLTIRTEICLEPRPDNTYNPDAIALVLPPHFGGTIIERHLGYMRENDLWRYQKSLKQLFKAHHSVGCEAVLHFREYSEEIHEIRESNPDIFEQATSLLTNEEMLRYGVEFSQLELALDDPEAIQAFANEVSGVTAREERNSRPSVKELRSERLRDLMNSKTGDD